MAELRTALDALWRAYVAGGGLKYLAGAWVGMVAMLAVFALGGDC